MGSMSHTNTTTSVPLLFEDKPMFALDVGRGSARVMQVARGKSAPRVVGYGVTTFDHSVIENGVIVKHEVIAGAVQNLFKNGLIGDITTNRVALTVPVSRAFVRSIDAPKLSDKELAEAVRTEVEQYIPAAPDSLYIDYSQVTDTKGKTSVLVVAIPRKIVDSHVTLARMLGLEPVLVQTSSSAGTNLFARDPQSGTPSVLVDFGSDSADITIFDRNPVVSGTAACGGEQITKIISDALNVNEREAFIIKSRYGLTVSKKQAQIVAALKPILGLLTREIRRTIRYYGERSKSKGEIGQIVIMGGGANMPGLTDYLTDELRVPVRSFDPMLYLDFGRLQPLNESERMSYVTVAGLALYDPRKVFSHD
jgi:type IV pilus assembly protein PilM